MTFFDGIYDNDIELFAIATNPVIMQTKLKKGDG
jgi:hypothetical protein